MIFESHAHYDDAKFDADREEILRSLPEQGIGKVINVCSDGASLQTTPELAGKWDFIYAAVGIHPSDIGDMDDALWERLRELTLKDPREKKVVSVGEIGLDYYWEKDPEVREKQRFWFRKQLALAKEASLPVIIHSRDAAGDTMEIMKEAASDRIPGVIHCYSYEKEQALQYVDMGYYIGIGGVLTFKNGRKLRETAAAVPLSRILLETDSPYLAPEPHRGKRNSSLYLPLVVSALAEIKGVSEEEIEDITFQNAERLFGLSQEHHSGPEKI